MKGVEDGYCYAENLDSSLRYFEMGRNLEVVIKRLDHTTIRSMFFTLFKTARPRLPIFDLSQIVGHTLDNRYLYDRLFQRYQTRTRVRRMKSLLKMIARPKTILA